MNIPLWSSTPFEIPCPYCKQGTIKPNNIPSGYTETRQSLIDNQYHKGKGIVHPTTEQLCSQHLKCDRCDEALIMTYIQIEDVRHHDEFGNEISEYAQVRYFPAPPMIEIPSSCPATVRNILCISFNLFWIDLPSCANKLRVAVEELMNEQQVPVARNLHARIDKFKSKHHDLGNFLESIKWIGNTGSHTQSMTKEAVLDAYRLIEYALEQLYNDRQQELSQLSARINANKKH